ncbi:hypothetical protein [Parabacteroides sp. AM08-6]|uniref:hypothetical protein n=1 Tax=Parabacteroides sp. AM08-6 TaxID=2292053 RepID=UPI001F31CB05|nr:hypothetical protein [Parabacteroides sp. AM08-6]
MDEHLCTLYLCKNDLRVDHKENIANEKDYFTHAYGFHRIVRICTISTGDE